MNSKMRLFYKMLNSYIKARFLNKPAPISTHINITSQCPKVCCYCDSWKRFPLNMPTDEVLEIFKSLDQVGVSRITLHGGDPLMHPDFSKIVRAAREYNFFITISLRETLIRQHLEDLKYVDLVFVSFDGGKRAHDAQKGEGSFEELMRAFTALKESRIPFQSTTVLTKINKDDIDFIIATSKRLDFYTHFQPLQFPPFKKSEQAALKNPGDNPLAPLILSKEEYTEIGKKLVWLKNKGVHIATSKKIIKLLFMDWPVPTLTFLPYRLDRSIRCWSGLLYNNIAVTGELFPCGYYDPIHYQEKAPNVFSEGYENALKKNIKDGSCQTCLIPCYMELNAMFSLNLSTIMNWLPKVVSFGRRRRSS